MKNALIISVHFPPEDGAGVQRALKFVKYLDDFQWQPTVLTVNKPIRQNVDPTFLKEIPESVSVVPTRHFDLAEPLNYTMLAPEERE